MVSIKTHNMLSVRLIACGRNKTLAECLGSRFTCTLFLHETLSIIKRNLFLTVRLHFSHFTDLGGNIRRDTPTYWGTISAKNKMLDIRPIWTYNQNPRGVRGRPLGPSSHARSSTTLNLLKFNVLRHNCLDTVSLEAITA